MFRSLDHLILMTRDLPSASSDYSKVFGCEPVWRGVHDGLGTENAIFSVNNTYLEILAPRAKGAGADFVNSVIDADGEGLAGLALETSDIGRLKKELSERYDTPGLKYMDIKNELIETIISFFEIQRSKKEQLLANPNEVNQKMILGQNKAKKIAQKTLQEVKSATGLL